MPMPGRPLLTTGLLCVAGLAACSHAPATEPAKFTAYIVDEMDAISEEAPPHGAIGMSTAYRISDGAVDRTMEFRKRALHPGAAVGPHPIGNDEVYYVLSGEGMVYSDGVETPVTAGMAAYLYDGSVVGIRQTGTEPLVIIIAYPLPDHPRMRR